MCDKSIEVFWGEISPCEHLLQVYETDAVLLDSLEGFVAGGLRAGESAIVIASEAHLDALETRMLSTGINVAASTASDQYLPLLAEEVLDKFMDGDWPDDQRFVSAIGEILDRARRGGRRVRAFGEMVAVLWARGDVAATVRLEHLWHKLCQAEEFSLFCAYPRAGITKDRLESMNEICAAHSRLLATV